jgi:hypothetical protein
MTWTPTYADAVTLLPPLSREAQSGVRRVLPIAEWLVQPSTRQPAAGGAQLTDASCSRA